MLPPLAQNSLNILAAREYEYRKPRSIYKYVSSEVVAGLVFDYCDKIRLPKTSIDIIYSDRPGVKSLKHLLEFRLLDLEQDLLGISVVPRLLVWNDYSGERVSISVGLWRRDLDLRMILGQSMFDDTDTHRKTPKEIEHRLMLGMGYIESDMFDDLAALMPAEISIQKVRKILASLVEQEVISPVVAEMTKIAIGVQDSQYVFQLLPEDRQINLWNFYSLLRKALNVNSRIVLQQEHKTKDLIDQILGSVA